MANSNLPKRIIKLLVHNMRYLDVMILGPSLPSPYEVGVFEAGALFVSRLPHGSSQAWKNLSGCLEGQMEPCVTNPKPAFKKSIQALLSAPNPDDPLSEDIAKQ